MSENAAATTRDQMLRRIRAEYLEMPGLRLTCPQAERLWNLDASVCVELMDSLEHDGFLQRRHDGTYARPSDGPPSLPRVRMIKATPADERREHSQPKAAATTAARAR